MTRKCGIRIADCGINTGGRGLVRFSANTLSNSTDAQAENLYLTPSARTAESEAHKALERKWAKDCPYKRKIGPNGPIFACNRHKMIDRQAASENDGKIQNLDELKGLASIMRAKKT